MKCDIVVSKFAFSNGFKLCTATTRWRNVKMFFIVAIVLIFVAYFAAVGYGLYSCCI
jgi:hypothetical protein